MPVAKTSLSPSADSVMKRVMQQSQGIYTRCSLDPIHRSEEHCGAEAPPERYGLPSFLPA